jgi:hypothetical protein
MLVEEGRMNSSTYNRPEKRPSTMPNYVKTISKKLSTDVPKQMTSSLETRY